MTGPDRRRAMRMAHCAARGVPGVLPATSISAFQVATTVAGFQETTSGAASPEATAGAPDDPTGQGPT